MLFFRYLIVFDAPLQINEYVTSTTFDPTPLLVIGTAGAGKSAVMAKAAADAVKMARDKKIPAPKYVV